MAFEQHLDHMVCFGGAAGRGVEVAARCEPLVRIARDGDEARERALGFVDSAFEQESHAAGLDGCAERRVCFQDAVGHSDRVREAPGMDERAGEEAKQRRSDHSPGQPGEDPDIAGIVPGPQKNPWGDEIEVETETDEEKNE